MFSWDRVDVVAHIELGIIIMLVGLLAIVGGVRDVVYFGVLIGSFALMRYGFRNELDNYERQYIEKRTGKQKLHQ